MSVHAGDPTPRSPADVLRDRAYRLVESEVFGMHQFVRLVVFHFGTETYWECEYEINRAAFPQEWELVQPVVVKRVEYRRVV